MKFDKRVCIETEKGFIKYEHYQIAKIFREAQCRLLYREKEISIREILENKIFEKTEFSCIAIHLVGGNLKYNAINLYSNIFDIFSFSEDIIKLPIAERQQVRFMCLELAAIIAEEGNIDDFI